MVTGNGGYLQPDQWENTLALCHDNLRSQSDKMSAFQVLLGLGEDAGQLDQNDFLLF